MAKYIFSLGAEEDLRKIWRDIAHRNEPAADALLRRIFDKVELAADHPFMGASRPELSPTARILIEGRYIIIYEPTAYGIFIVAIVYGPRDLDNWLD
ncbi:MULTISPECIES: type II toxin-antitoxin system RelE/ParE family toxin [Rhizobium/Agrobacterium group]|uniref:type II toxin-antitoxin system RelE/ParE family toxin n=1 Tax=Rhizobium/Agrobacterium group TaxID=227290 RepID=UPI0022FFD1C4|nr:MULTISPECIES: type II toxin-antitoxin system RelE/ParE family toxin [Rhizobium/Agrobacterium group]MDA5633942.1 type II toxin-antitoxin system RelE/ParE family toxin [Agrobacterium sp. ST15.16.024]MDF1889457.1 type II toxin-antitoxin system RelE/ParE family toxin [Rhizobium rhizogenes]